MGIYNMGESIHTMVQVPSNQSVIVRPGLGIWCEE